MIKKKQRRRGQNDDYYRCGFFCASITALIVQKISCAEIRLEQLELESTQTMLAIV